MRDVIPQISLSVTQDPCYARLKDHVIAATGLEYYRDRDQHLAELIGHRLSELGLRDCAAYSARLAEGKAGGDELDVLIAHLTIGETYFFRDREQFDAIRDIVLPEILDRKQSSRRLRIWSAGCANGAEPYSLAILLEHELAHRVAGWQISIFASDINRRFLAEAEEGRFHEWALRSTSNEFKRQCFSTNGQVRTIHAKYKRRITFAHMNLVESEFPRHGTSGFDLILCRNVMIYFAAETSRWLIRQFHESLAVGGWFLTGAVEHNLENFSSFETVNATGATLYRKSARVGVPPPPNGNTGFIEGCTIGNAPLLAKAPVRSRLGGPEEKSSASGLAGGTRIGRSTACPTPIESLGFSNAAQAHSPANRDFFTAPLASGMDGASGSMGASPEIEPTNIDGLRRLADRGDWEQAVPYCRRLLAEDGLNPVVYFYHALVLEQMGNLAEAERSLRQAIYLDRNFLLAHYHLGLALTKGNQPRAAARSFENVLKLSGGVHDEQTVEDGDGVTVAGLKQMAALHLQKIGVS